MSQIGRIQAAEKIKNLIKARFEDSNNPDSPLHQLRGAERKAYAEKFWIKLTELEKEWGDACDTSDLIELTGGFYLVSINRDDKRYGINLTVLCEDIGMNYGDYCLAMAIFAIEDKQNNVAAAHLYISYNFDENTPEKVYEYFAKHKIHSIRRAISYHECTPVSILIKMMRDPDEAEDVKNCAKRNLLSRPPHPLHESTGFTEGKPTQEINLISKRHPFIKPEKYLWLYNAMSGNRPDLTKEHPHFLRDTRTALHEGGNHPRHEDTGYYIETKKRRSIFDPPHLQGNPPKFSWGLQ